MKLKNHCLDLHKGESKIKMGIWGFKQLREEFLDHRAWLARRRQLSLRLAKFVVKKKKKSTIALVPVSSGNSFWIYFIVI